MERWMLAFLPDPLQRATVPRDIAAGIAVALLAGVVAATLQAWNALDNAAPIFLIGVLLAASMGGSRVGFVTALTSFGLFNFFLVEPRYALQIVSADDLLSLLLFLAVALTVGHFAGRSRDQAHVARLKVRQLEALYEAGSQAAIAADRDALASIAAGAAARIRPGDWSFGPVEADFRGVQFPITSADGELALKLSNGRSLDPMYQRSIQLLVRLIENGLERVRLQRLLADQRLAEETERLRSDLINAVAHDLRTPIAGIATAAAALQDHGEQLTAADRTDLAANIRASADRLARFTSKILTTAKLETGALEPELEWIAVDEVVNSAVAGLTLSHPDLSVERVLAGGHLLVETDPVLLEQALFNLLENAATHAANGQLVEVFVGHDATGLTVTVSDYGGGIDPTLKAHLFEPWQRGYPSGRGPAGLGLGLHITRSFIESLGGWLEINGRPDGAAGTAVTVHFAPQAVRLAA